MTNRVEIIYVAEEFSSGPVDKNNDVTPKNTIPNDKRKSLHSLRHTFEQEHRPIIHKKLVQQNKRTNDANWKPPVVINNSENDKLQDKLKRTVPENTTHGDIIKKERKMKMFGTSMIKCIRNKEFNFQLQRCHAELKTYPGATIKEWKHNTQCSTQMDTPDIVLIRGWCNNISPKQNQEKLMEEGFAKEIISIGSYCWDKGVNEIIISGLLCRKGQYNNSRVLKVNDYLQKFVLKKDFVLSIIQKSGEIIYLKMACIY